MLGGRQGTRAVAATRGELPNAWNEEGAGKKARHRKGDGGKENEEMRGRTRDWMMTASAPLQTEGGFHHPNRWMQSSLGLENGFGVRRVLPEALARVISIVFCGSVGLVVRTGKSGVCLSVCVVLMAKGNRTIIEVVCSQ